ncbi:MAG: multifunctional oxoglutarate decarboxylase/oxoglutarate dehydrogenase thiamine pyrophosphate-binding subunit/dihydrolipoyllysine-residue succinyltransferase subunit, partial [Pseudonocardia sp.]
MYQRFLEDPSTVDPAWHEFFADYRPVDVEDRTPAEPTPAEPTPAEPTSAEPGPAPTPSTEPAHPTEHMRIADRRAGAPSAIDTGGVPKPRQDLTGSTEAQSAATGRPPAGSTSRAAKPAVTGSDGATTSLRGVASAVVRNMNASLTVPTATSVRSVPAKLLADNRVVINNQLKRTRGGKISFTHLIGFAVVQALIDLPVMNRHFMEADGTPTVVQPDHVNLGLAIDLPGRNGQRSLVVVSIKGCEVMNFAQFWSAYEDIVRKARSGALAAEDFSGTTLSLTNPGTLGTNHSVPRLMLGQGTIIGVGAMEYPAAFQGASDERLAEIGISKIITLTSTYDHRIIQGAESGDFLRRIHALLLGEDGFYDDIFRSLRVPYEPVRWVQDIPVGAVDKTARVIELIDAYRTRGHLMADTDPLNYRQRRHPDLDVLSHGLTLWDLDREFASGGFGGQERMKLRDVLGLLRNSYCRTIGVEYMHIADPTQRAWLQERIEVPHQKPSNPEQKYVLSKLNAAEAFETFLQTKYVGQKRFSLEGGETVIPLLDAVLDKAAEHELDEVVIGMPHRGRLNVLANIVGKPISQIFREFEG